MSKDGPKVWPVILSGGSGTRLWPKSRILYPKQFHSLTSEKTLLQEALMRVVDTSIYAKPMVICNEDHRFIVAEQAEELGVALQGIVLEPEGRNTAPAVAVAACIIRELDPNGIVLVLASDHHIGDADAFTAAVARGIEASNKGFICTFGITPNAPEVGYGYIKRTNEEVTPGVYKIQEFREKPDLATAKKYVADPSYAWNAGIFLFSAAAMLDELAKFEPGIGPACKAAIDQGSTDNINAVGFQRLHPKEFAKAKAMSLDYAIMERTQKSAVIPMDAQWTDVGSWSSLWATCVDKESNSLENREARNFTHGSVELDDVEGCYLSTDGPLVAAIGVRDLCIVATEDAVLVLPMDQAQNVGKMAKKLKQATKTSRLAIKHRSEYKPWGSMRELSTGSNYRVIELTIKAGAATSLQMHYHRAMHQVVVKGTALMYQGDEKMLLQENQSAFVPIGMKHRLANPGSVPLVVMEVQSGSYLGNDDIVRIEDPVAQVAGTPRGLPTMAAGAGPHKPALVKVGEDQDHFSAPKTVVVESHNGAFFLQMFGAMAVGAVIAVQFMNRK